MASYHALVVPAAQVKTVKTELERRGLLHRRLKIGKHSDNGFMVIPTTLTTDDLVSSQPSEASNAAYLDSLAQEFDTTAVAAPQECETTPKRNALQSAIAAGLDEMDEILSAKGVTKDELLASIPTSYTIYQPLLLLPVTTLARPAWRHLLFDTHPHDNTVDPRLSPFLEKIAAALLVTHIAINAPIPTDTSLSTSSANAVVAATEEDNLLTEANSFSSSNLLRSPTALITLFGDFGAALSPFPEHVPTTQDLEDSFWVTTTQNGLQQTWAPRYTMFSKGNVTEKTRLLNLASVTQLQNQEWTAVDLFAGIGYFAFSYARAGAARVLCWDLNPWSVEGLCRGAALNGWTSSVLASPLQDKATAASGIDQLQQQSSDIDKGSKFLIWCESNNKALDRLSQARADLTPVRHVNCGMLPDAGKAWKTAVECLDWQLGGWLHLHETVREDKVEARAEEIRHAVEALVQSLSLAGASSKTVRTEHIERVKSVGPRMLHIVVDLCISGACGGGVG